MATVKWQGVDYGEAVTSLKTGEIIAIERSLGIPMQDWSGVIGAMAMLYATVRRKNADAITWAQIEDLDVDELDDIIIDTDEPVAGEGDAAPLAGGAPARKSSSGTRRTPRKAAARSRNGARTT